MQPPRVLSSLAAAGFGMKYQDVAQQQGSRDCRPTLHLQSQYQQDINKSSTPLAEGTLPCWRSVCKIRELLQIFVCVAAKDCAGSDVYYQQTDELTTRQGSARLCSLMELLYLLELNYSARAKTS